MEMITVVHTSGPFLDQCWQGWEFLQSFNWGWIMPESVNDGLGFNQEVSIKKKRKKKDVSGLRLTKIPI